MTGISDGELAALLSAAKAICSEAGEMVRCARQTSSVDVSTKGGFELVTSLDQEIDRLFRDRIAHAFPSDQILSEESQHRPDLLDGVCWIVDPLDGTANFVHGLPHVAISAAGESHLKKVVAE